MFNWFAYFVGMTVGGVFATIIFMAGGADAAVAAVGLPLVVGAVGVLVTAFLRRGSRATEEAAA